MLVVDVPQLPRQRRESVPLGRVRRRDARARRLVESPGAGRAAQRAQSGRVRVGAVRVFERGVQGLGVALHRDDPVDKAAP